MSFIFSHRQMRGAAMSLTAAVRGFVVVLLFVSVEQSQNGWGVTYTSTRICAAEGSTVDINCTFKYPAIINNQNTEVNRKLWLTKWSNNQALDITSDPDYKGRVEHHVNENKSTLTIKNVSQRDSAEYKFRIETNQPGGLYSGAPGVFLYVTDSSELPSVSVSPAGEIVEDSSVTLICCSDANSETKYTWYKKDEAKPVSENFQLIFRSIQSSDSGQYYCTAGNRGGKKNTGHKVIDVKYAPKLPSVSVSPSAEIVEGSSVTLTCSSDANPAADYTWYKNNKALPERKDVYQFISISSEDSGNYFCMSENLYGQTNSTSLSIDVQYAPKLPSVSVSPSAEMVEDSSVTLTCSSDANPAANYTWYKEDEESPKVSGQNFTITNIKREHSGSYYCVVQNKRGCHNSTLQLTVLPESLKLGLIGASLVFFLAILSFLVFLLLRKKRSSEPSPEPEETSDNNEQSLPSHLEEQEEFHYTSVRFLKKQTDPIYYNFSSAAPRRQKQEEDESVEYAAVKFKSATSDARTRGQETEEDQSALYSTVKKV